jgi:tricorn protease
MTARSALLSLGFSLATAVHGATAAPGAYIRQPDLHGDRIVFCAEGDLWLVGNGGGGVLRLTVHPGTEHFPSFSPDGASIAFTGEYDGNRDVFVISSTGGEPRRLTWHPASDEVIGWTPDGTRVLFRSPAESPHGEWEIFAVPAAGGDPDKLPLGWAARLDIDRETGRWAFNRKSWEGATWKRYRGGTAPDIWIGHPDRADFRKVTDFDGVNAYPMWHAGRVYFVSDQGGTANLWSIRPDGSDRRRHTDFDNWDARWPAMSPDGRIVFTLAADLHVFDAQTGAVRKVEVELPSDRVRTRVRYPGADRTLTWFDVSPEGDRLAVTTRGEIFSVPVKDGVTLPITRGTGARESWGRFDAEGRRIVYVSDAPREEEIRVADAWGRGEPKVVRPAGPSGWHFPPSFSPDGKWIAYADQTQTLYVLPSEGGTPRVVDRSSQREIREYAWSPDGRWLAYVKVLATDYGSVFLYDTRDGQVHPVTGPTTDDADPAWDPEGRYLYFLSRRSTNPILGSQDWQNIEVKNTRPYLVLLRKDVRNPFAPLAGLPADGKDGEEDTKGKDAKEGKQDKEKEPPKPVEIDLDGLAARVVEFPVPRGLYGSLQATAKQVFYLSYPVQGMAEGPGLFDDPEPQATLTVLDLEKKEAKPFLEGVSAFLVAARADKLALMKRRGELYVVDAANPPGADLSKSKVSLDDVVIELDPREEWAQIYYEGWRHMREFYWDPGLGGVDWTGVRDHYATLLGRLATRDDLRDLMGEVIGELGTSHTYVWGGDPGLEVPRVGTGLLGAELRREGGAYRVTRIYRGDPADGVRSPLDEPGVRVVAGDYLLAVNHRPFEPGLPFAASLEGLAEREVVLTVNGKPTSEGARDVVVKPLRSETRLRYVDWVRSNREYVARETHGKIGYVHLPDMWTDGLVAFNTWFYPQLDREGMIVDVRWNGGGAVSQMIVERLRRKPLSFDRARGGGLATYPYRVLNGPFVVITNEFAGSDGDIFPTAVQLERLAPVIGMRSWGGVIGIRGDKPLVDGGMLTQPEFAWWDPKQGWGLENRGVIPDIEVQNEPQELARGEDAQLDRAIAEVLRLHAAHPPLRPDFGPPRDRSREGFRDELTPGR